MTKIKTLLITMPFGFANRPALGISLLKSILKKNGFECDIQYLQLPFVAHIGWDKYFQLAQFAPRSLIGEWLFAHHLFPQELPPTDRYYQEVMGQFSGSFDPELLDGLLDLRDYTGSYLDECLEKIAWEQYKIVGFSTTFAQNTASLALANSVKANHPDITIIFGGANCEGEMGLELHRQFPFIDFVCSGESDELFIQLIQRLDSDLMVEDLQGLIYRKGGESIANGHHAPPITNLDELPVADFDDYFKQLKMSGLEYDPKRLRLMMETSRGCWWGAKSQCAFCGLNNELMLFRSKSGQRVVDEIAELARKYPQVNSLDITDKILDVRYFKDVLPGLIEQDLGLDIFYFSKANMNKEQIRMLLESGVKRIQPGIESLNTDVLNLMRKGCTATQNIQLLKWATKYGVNVIWNFLAGLPNENPRSYQEMTEMIPALYHLQPPTGLPSVVRLDRFSPYFEDPQRFGIVNVRPAAAYRHVYPFSDEVLNRLAYYFDFDYADGRNPQDYLRELSDAVQVWQNQIETSSLLSICNNGQLVLYEGRPGQTKREIKLSGLKKELYELCDEAQSLKSILKHIDTRSDDYEEVSEPDEIQRILDEFVSLDMMLFLDGKYLSLAISIDESAQKFLDHFVAAIDG